MKNKKINLITQPNTTLANKTGAWRTEKPITDLSACIGCSLCAKICPEGCIEMEKSVAHGDKLKPETDYDYCKGCGLCAHECPVKAIKMIKDY
ncbi:MAG: 4Fe-4S binding protein [Patescibacteria group bacterium]|jgi:2-oxoacid:acceptor oxidoreductase delta subunit (pyruvate/2-ketoisovalerate family)